jgi:hypothetical protein
MGRDARNAQRSEQNYNARNEVQTCIVCGRLFTRHVKDKVCSIDCKRKAEEQAKLKAS